MIVNHSIFKNVGVIENLLDISNSYFVFIESSLRNVSSKYDYLINTFTSIVKGYKFLCSNCFPGIFHFKNSSFSLDNCLFSFSNMFDLKVIPISAIYSEQNPSFILIKNLKFSNLISNIEGTVKKKNCFLSLVIIRL